MYPLLEKAKALGIPTQRPMLEVVEWVCQNPTKDRIRALMEVLTLDILPRAPANKRVAYRQQIQGMHDRMYQSLLAKERKKEGE